MAIYEGRVELWDSNFSHSSDVVITLEDFHEVI